MLLKPGDEVKESQPQDMAHQSDLQHVESSLASLVFAYERLRTVQAVRELLLGEPGLGTYLPKQSLEPLLVSLRDESFHVPTIRSGATYPKRG